MRGTPSSGIRAPEPTGIIPAYAGNTTRHRRRWSSWRDHPRVCGEHRHDHGGSRFRGGSSPRMRGTHLRHLHFLDFTGIIPAYAGNTPAGQPPTDHRRDHPRVCGEHFKVAIERLNSWGSSPRMRGTLVEHDLPSWLEGIIPAYAGNTGPPIVWLSCRRDHPRVCGEHTSGVRVTRMVRGSSPRMRGTPEDRQGRVDWSGIIPAYAGNTR